MYMSNNKVYYSCLSCREVFTTNVFKLHSKRCEIHGGKYKPKVYDNLNCPYCSKTYEKENAFRQHIPRCNKNPNKISTIISKKGRAAWNKGLTKDTDPRLQSVSNAVKKAYLNGTLSRKITPLSKEKKEKMSATIAKNKNRNGGYKRVPYINYIRKSGKTIKLRGTYEVRLATLLDYLNINWEYEKPVSYKDNTGISRYCYPDFYLTYFNVYLDTKGYLTELAKSK